MIDAAVVGASGYGGGELIRILLRHPQVKLSVIVSETYAGKPLSAALPGLTGISDLKFQAFNNGESLKNCQVVFLAQENGRAMKIVPQLLEYGCKIVDLSADFRFRDIEVYNQWYKMEHACPVENSHAVYGLPELNREAIKDCNVVGNPGCYPTASILALAPLLNARLIDPTDIIIDAKSGVSGAGRANFSLDYHYPEINESVSAYKIAGSHRHTPEIETAVSEISGVKTTVTFTPHLIPMSRGILATCYASTVRNLTQSELVALFTEFYRDSPFVVTLSDSLPATKHTLGSNRCHIGLAYDPRTKRITVVSTIDNLVKGAAGQAVQNMNLMFGFDETAALIDCGGIWP